MVEFEVRETMKSDYYYTKDGRDEWTVHGRRHHIQIDRTDAPTGRADEHGEDILQAIYYVSDRARLINTADQFDTDAHGFTRLKDALKYAVEKLAIYDERVDPQKRLRRNPGSPSQFEFHLKPSGWTGAPCPICGCATRNLRARHRALKADEAHRWGVPYIKRVKVAFGTDFSDEPLKE